MTWNYAYTPNIWPSVLTIVLMMTLSVFSLRRRSVPGALQLLIACLFAAAWAASLLMNYAAVDMATKILWLKVQGTVQLPIIIAITCFILEYAWPGRWLTRRNLALLYFPVLPSVILLLTNDLHHQAWRSFSLANGALRPEFGLGSWILVFYFFGVMEALNLIVFGRLFRRSPQHRWPVALMLAGQIVGRSLFLTYNGNPLISVLPLNLIGMSFEFLIYAIVLFGFRIFDPLPLARQTVIQQLQTGVLVLDPQGRIVSLNPAAERILGATAGQARGRAIQELLPACPQELLARAGRAEIELSMVAGENLRCYTLELSPLNDWRGLEVGRLLLLNDVTETKRAQAQIIEQQRALAMLQERELLARELHDSLGQVLGFASLKMGATRKLIADGKLAKADDQLAHLENVVTEAHADLRENILHLGAAPTGERTFFSALQHYLDGFRMNYGIQVDCSIEAGMDDSLFAPEAQMQLFRILQEVFSNARKHAQANWVRLSFEMEGSRVRIRIQDNGKGFDPQQAAPAGERHFGLRFMRERAEQLGGNLRVDSTPGEGTCVEVEVPVNGER